MGTIRFMKGLFISIFSLVLILTFITLNYKKQTLGKIEDLRVEFGERLRIIVLTYNRAKSLSRLLKTLNDAYYFGNEILLDIWIDRSTDGFVNLDTVRVAEDFKFNHGEKRVFQHSKHVGIYGQWLSTWTPSTPTEIAVFLEDDLTVSPYFYKYLTLVHLKYGSHPDINGFALQGKSIKHAHGTGVLAGPDWANVFLYPVLGTWGFSPCTQKWVQFTRWFNTVYPNTSVEPIVPGNIASTWYKQFKKAGKANGMWSIWHIYYAWQSKEYTLYPNNKRKYSLPFCLQFKLNTFIKTTYENKY